MDSIQRSTSIAFQSSGHIDFTVHLVGGGDWSYAGFYGDEGLRAKPQLAEALFEIFFSMGAERIYAPTPVEFNGKIIKPEAFTTRMPLAGFGGNVLMLRNKECPADGTALRYIGDAGTFSGGGCPMIVAAYKRCLAFAHAGRDCLLDRVRVNSLDEERSRPYGSVVSALIENLKEESYEFDNFNLRDVRVWVYGSIRPEDFGDSLHDRRYGPYNAKTFGYVWNRFGPECVEIKDNEVRLNLPVLIQKQFMLSGVAGENIDLTHAYLPSEFPTTRNGRPGKYAIVVVRTS